MLSSIMISQHVLAIKVSTHQRCLRLVTDCLKKTMATMTTTTTTTTPTHVNRLLLSSSAMISCRQDIRTYHHQQQQHYDYHHKSPPPPLPPMSMTIVPNALPGYHPGHHHQRQPPINELPPQPSTILNKWIREVVMDTTNNTGIGVVVPKQAPAVQSNRTMRLDYVIIRDPRSYSHLTVIRRRKMSKHKRMKWRKKMVAMLKKKNLKKNIMKEKVFRAELLAQIKEAEDFDPELYVNNILDTIDRQPKDITKEEYFEHIRNLIRKNRKETNFIVEN
ncbi:uncharacterized protein LOC128958563 [Oppia nitens]|uniref:uncharacterized protein LOC128958563 n=1 Tax=Oppia nitens TaxID=1686743 RepID=UPI0023DA0B8A|nr:uncharacterized protein LOC128958563 [Oppia nitens]